MFAVTACGTRVIYAGPGPGRRLVAENDLGWGVDWDPTAVAAAMTAALSWPAAQGDAERLATWTRGHASQDSVAALAAAAVEAVLRPLSHDG
jgi:hypothetical protein